MYRILIADDSSYMRETLRDILREAGHEVVAEAVSGSNAVAIYRALLPDIVIMDIVMPEVNGIEAMKEILQINNDAVVIMLTVIGKPEIVLEALNHGAKGYITKPFVEESVLNAICKAKAKTDT